MKEPTTYWRALEVRDIAESLIADFHEHVSDLNVRYLFESKHSKVKGRTRLGRVQKVSGLGAYLAQSAEMESFPGDRPPAPVAPSFLVMVIAYDTWLLLTGPQRIALVDHELSRIAPDGDLRGHDVEEFSEVVRRHGAWQSGIVELIEASKQAPLFESAGKESR
jgi:hypothetical protein